MGKEFDGLNLQFVYKPKQSKDSIAQKIRFLGFLEKKPNLNVSGLVDRWDRSGTKCPDKNVYESFWRGFLTSIMTILRILKRRHL